VRRIDGGRLAGFEVGEPLHVGVEPLPDFLHRRFHRLLQEHLFFLPCRGVGNFPSDAP
jgi:hypothetical protein